MVSKREGGSKEGEGSNVWYPAVKVEVRKKEEATFGIQA